MRSIGKKNSIPRQRLWFLISLMALSTILFVIGIMLERGGEARETSEARSPQVTVTPKTGETAGQQHIVATMVGGENGELSESNESDGEHTNSATPVVTPHIESGEEGGENAEGATVVVTRAVESNEAGSEQNETATVNTEHTGEGTQAENIMGINIENPAFVVAAVIVWVTLIILVLLFGRVVLIPIILVALGTTLFDLAEVSFQISRSNSGLTILAALVAIAHVAVAVVTGMILVQREATPTTQVKGSV